MPREKDVVKNVGKHAAAAKEEVESAISDKVDQAQQYVGDIKDKAGEVWDDTKKKVQDGAGKVQEYAEHNPWKVAAISALTGFLLGALIMRSRKD